MKEWIKKNKISTVIIIVLVILSAYLYFSGRDSLDNKPFEISLNPDPYFIMSNDLLCIVKKSSDKKNIGIVLSLLDLTTDNPRMLSNNGASSPMTKFFEAEDTLVLGLVASVSGSTDIFVLNKEPGEFARTSSGNLGGVYAFASKGTCK